MGLFNKIKNILDNQQNNIIEKNQLSKHEVVKKEALNVKYTELFSKCQNIYEMIVNYECQMSGKDGIELYSDLYEKTKDTEYLILLDEEKHKLFVKPQIIKNLIEISRDTYGLEKESFYEVIRNYFEIIATNKEFSSEFCFNYLHNEIEKHYVYYPDKYIDFGAVVNECSIKINRDKLNVYSNFCANNECPYCKNNLSNELTRSKKCNSCNNKIYVLKFINTKLYLDEEGYKYFKEEQELNKVRVDLCRMILNCGYRNDELEEFLNKGNINRLSDIAWKKLSEKRNLYFETGQIDLLPNINYCMAKVLAVEEKYEGALLFVCEAIYEEGSPIEFHPGHPYENIGGKIRNKYDIDTTVFNDRHKPRINKTYIELLKTISINFDSSKFSDKIKCALQNSSHFYLKKTPDEMYEEIIRELNSISIL